jgi:GrpB-like predicted nucleotidyltransferase (UPF0157 family)
VEQTPILPYPYPSPHPEVRDWNPHAPEAAERVMGLIAERLPEVTIAHVGSTAVPGCAGKGYLDFVIAYRGAGELAAINEALFALGFGRQRSRDPFPETRPMRTGAFNYEGEMFLLHVHVVMEESGEMAELIAFRDKLRDDPGLVAEYVAAKHAVLGAGVRDGVEYAQNKGRFIAAVNSR